MEIIWLFLFYLQLDIVQQEYIHEEGLDQFEVVKAAFDTRGDWLATVEERTQKGSELEINLKLWAYNEQTQRYYLFAHHSQPGYMLYMSSYQRAIFHARH